MKVLKTAAIVIGAAAVIAVTGGVALGGLSVLGAIGATTSIVGATLGISAGAVLAIGAAAIAIDLSLIASAIAPSRGGSQTKWKADPYAGLPYLLGRTLAAGNIIFRRSHGGTGNPYETFVTILSVCTLQSIDTTFLNKTTVNFDGGGSASGTYSGQVWQRTQLGACPEPAALTSPVGNPAGWTAQHKLSGLAATMLTFKYDAKTTNGLTSEPAPAWIVHGVNVYDPRLDDTYPGGSGPCRAFDESTYVWSENPHLHALTWTIGRFQNGVRVAGIGNGPFAARAKITGVDVGSFVEGANLDDARGWKLGGQVTTRPDAPWNSLKAMLQAGGATPVLIGGRIACVNRAPRVSLATIARSDIVGECTLSTTQPRRTRINGVIPQYRSEAHDWEMVSASAISVDSYVAMDGDERTKEIPYPLVQDVNQVAQLARYDIEDAREASPGTIPLKPYWLNYKIGDCLTFQPEDDLSIKVQLTGRAIEPQSGVVTYTVRGETDAKHAYALGQTGTAPPIVSLVYDPTVPAPAATDWSLAGVTLTMNNAAVTALVVSGLTGNASAQTVVFEVRQVQALQNEDGTVRLNEDGSTMYGEGSDQAWMTAAELPASTMNWTTSSGIIPTGVYEVGVSYRVRGALGTRLVLGPVAAGAVPQAATASDVAALEQTVTAQAAMIDKLGGRLANANIP